MALFRTTPDSLEPVAMTSFTAKLVKERQDLQRLLCVQIDLLGDDLMVVAEEYGDFQDSRRRIDLLAVDTAGRLVVIELKRTDDGGHMEHQALRYAAMVSAMTFEQLVGTFAYNNKVSMDEARQRSPHRIASSVPRRPPYRRDHIDVTPQWARVRGPRSTRPVGLRRRRRPHRPFGPRHQHLVEHARLGRRRRQAR